MKLLRKILLPFVPIYKAITWTRNYAYNHNILKSRSYDTPVICVGNLSVGGTGKTPMIEYLIRLLQNDHKVATLSRGYKRTTKGFILADETATAKTIGDEPLQFYNKFKNIFVAVDTNRQHGIEQLLKFQNAPDVILLDDAFQHRRVRAGLNVLLSSYHKLYVDDMSLPTGDLREPISGAKRADIIVITKCPEALDLRQKNDIIKKLNKAPHQKVFFSWINYANEIISVNNRKPLSDLKTDTFTLVTGIANAGHLVTYLERLGLNFEHLNFGDHHHFTNTELERLKQKKTILTTEKDFTRLRDYLEHEQLYYLPIKVRLDNEEGFNSSVKDFVNSF